MKRQFLQGYEFRLDDGPDCRSFLQTQGIDGDIAPNFDSVLELIYDDDELLSAVKLYLEGEFAVEYADGKIRAVKSGSNLLKHCKPENAGGKFRYRDIPMHIPHNFVRVDNGPHYLGGETPQSFRLPVCNSAMPFQYLGMIGKADPLFDWLPFDLHPTCPIYLNMGMVFLDYADPTTPQFINATDVDEWGSSYDDLNPKTEIVFERWSLATQKTDRFDNEYACGVGHAGLPDWVQYPEIPRCPKSGETMRFVAQLQSSFGLGVMRSTVPEGYKWRKNYFSQLNFWGDGCLFVFFEPASKVACYLIQNT